MNAGYLVNTVLPARLGEVVRAVMLAHLEDVRVGHAVSTVVVERVLDLLTTIVILGIMILFVSLPSESVTPLIVATTLAVGALLTMIVAGANPDLTHRLIRLVTARLPERWSSRVHHLVDSFLDGFKVLHNAGIAGRLVILSIVIWLLVAAAMQCMLLAFHLDLPPSAPFFVLALIQLSFIIPSTPGHLGVFQFAATEALRIGYNVNPSEALGFAIVTNLVSFAPPALLGLWFVWRSGLSFSSLVSFGKQAQAEELSDTHAAGDLLEAGVATQRPGSAPGHTPYEAHNRHVPNGR